MKINKLFYITFITGILLQSCGSLKEAGKIMRNEKTRTTDEFLVQKKEPLSIPPNYNELPRPDSAAKEKKKAEIEKILNIQEEEKVSSTGKSTSLEDSLIEQITK